MTLELHGVGAFACSLGHDVAGVVDDVGVVARAADHRVGAAAAVERVVAGVAGERVGERVAGAVDVPVPVSTRFSTFAAERVGHARANRVRALARRLGHDVAGVVDDVGVVPGTAGHRVGAGAAVERVVAGVARQALASVVAGAVDVAPCPVSTRFSTFAAKRVADARADGVGALARGFGHGIGGVVDDVGVVARAADQRVGAGAAIERVVPRVAGQRVGERVAGAVDLAGAGQHQVLDVRPRRIGDARAEPCRVPSPAASVTTSPTLSTT